MSTADEKEAAQHEAVYSEKADVADYKADAIAAENFEHDMTVLQAVKEYPMASFWAFIMSCTIIMESYDVFLIGNFLGLPRFKRDFGVCTPQPDKPCSDYANWVVVAKWQSSMQVSGQLGALIGVIMAGWITTWIGYRWTTLLGLMLLNVFIFVFYYADSLPVMFAAQILEGIPWGFFIANAPAYCSEIVPIQLRAPATQMLQMFWAIGSIIVGGVCYAVRNVDSPYAYRLPIALQWMFPTPLAVLIFFAPESPWWLVRKGRVEEAAKSVVRLGRKSAVNPTETVAMMRRVVELEKEAKPPNHLELFKGTDLRRTLIVAGVYAAQNLTGNLIANQAVYFFQQAGIGDSLSFALGLITSALQWVAVMASWVLTTYFGRRSIYVWGSLANFLLLVALGIAACITPHQVPSEYAQASLGLIVSVFFCLGPAPASWVFIGETSSIRLRPLTTGFGRAVYYIVEFPCIFLASYMLNPDEANLGGKCGFVWGGTAFVCLVLAYFFLPEMKHRSYREIDIMFRRRVPARQWKKYVVDINDDE